MNQLERWHRGGHRDDEWPPLPPKAFVRGNESSIETDPKCIEDVKIGDFDTAYPPQETISLQDHAVPMQVPQDWGDELLRWIYMTTTSGAPFPIGTFGMSNSEHKGNCTAIFSLSKEDLSSLPATKVFVPMCELDYEYQGEQFIAGPASTTFWRVRKAINQASLKHTIEKAKEQVRKTSCQDLVAPAIHSWHSGH
ncbi:hypothetical protein HRS9139_02713 [Pyrenophora teres f. teres]|nr:hypothetical protein HRS9139_02713 [Pyrenophora teres f. teres]